MLQNYKKNCIYQNKVVILQRFLINKDMKRTLEEAKLITILVFAVMLLRVMLHLIFMNAFGPAYISPYTGIMLLTGAEMLVYSLLAMLIIIFLRDHPKETKKDRKMHGFLLYGGLGGFACIIIAHFMLLHYMGYDFEWKIASFTAVQWVIFLFYLAGYLLETITLLGVGILVPRSPLKVALLVSSTAPILGWLAVRLIASYFIDPAVVDPEAIADLFDDVFSDGCTIWILFTVPYALHK